MEITVGRCQLVACWKCSSEHKSMGKTIAVDIRSGLLEEGGNLCWAKWARLNGHFLEVCKEIKRRENCKSVPNFWPNYKL